VNLLTLAPIAGRVSGVLDASFDCGPAGIGRSGAEGPDLPGRSGAADCSGRLCG